MFEAILSWKDFEETNAINLWLSRSVINHYHGISIFLRGKRRKQEKKFFCVQKRKNLQRICYFSRSLRVNRVHRSWFHYRFMSYVSSATGYSDRCLRRFDPFNPLNSVREEKGEKKAGAYLRLCLRRSIITDKWRAASFLVNPVYTYIQ